MQRNERYKYFQSRSPCLCNKSPLRFLRRDFLYPFDAAETSNGRKFRQRLPGLKLSNDQECGSFD